MKRIALGAVLTALSLGADTLPDGYMACEYVTIPRRAESPYYNVVDTGVKWKDVGKIAFRASTPVDPDNPSTSSIKFIAMTKVGSDGPAWPYAMFSKTWDGKINCSGPGKGSFTPDDLYPFDGSVHDFAIEDIAETANYAVMFGAAWRTVAYAHELDWYRVQMWDKSGGLVADFCPCRRIADGAVGFYDIVRNDFYTRKDPSWPEFWTGGQSSDVTVMVTAPAASFGTLAPAVGLHILPAGEPQAFSLSGGVDIGGGVLAYVSSDGRSRALFERATVTTRDESAVYLTPSFAVTLEGDATVDWSFTNVQSRIVAEAEHGTVTVGTETAGCVTNWCAPGESVSVSVTPRDGYSFLCWEGEGVTFANELRNPLEMKMTESPLHLCAVFIPVDPSHVAQDVTWASGVPELGPGDRVTVPEGATVVLSSATPRCASFDVAGTLVFSNSCARLDADAITVRSTGVIRAGTDGYVLNGMTPNRVWLKGTTLTVEAGGSVSADAAGYAGTNGPCWTAEVSRSVGLRNHSPFGGAYGGGEGYAQHFCRNQDFVPAPQPYGSAEWPYDAGSGGGAFVRSGGGAVVLDFTGAVTVDGRVSADASRENYSGYPASEAEGTGPDWMSVNAPNGSGGGVVIQCRTIGGSGSVTANGVNTAAWYGGGGGGSGGRVAVHYDPSAQSNATCRVRFESRGGVSMKSARGEFWGEPGTIWFSDNQFLDTYGTAWPFSGTWCSAVGQPASVEKPALDVSGGDLRFAGPLTLTVAGDLSVTGNQAYAGISGLRLATNATVTVGGDLLVRNARFSILGGGSLTVEGDFEVADAPDQNQGALVFLTAGATNGVDEAYGFTLDVKGKWTVGEYGVVVPSCHPENGAIPLLKARDFLLSANGVVTASQQGYLFGPGCETRRSGHGGLAGGSAAGTVTYGSETEPLAPGSGTGVFWLGCRGGGVVYLDVANKGEIYGKILADATDTTLHTGTSGIYALCGASGGSIYLRIKRLYASATALVRAMGAGPANGGKYAEDASLGGGGRVAIWTLRDRSEWTLSAETVAPTCVPANTAFPPTIGTYYSGKLPEPGFSVIVR